MSEKAAHNASTTRPVFLVLTHKKWAAYKKGFGNLKEDHWLSLMKYRNFRLGSAKAAFKLHVGKYRGDAGDAIRGAYSGIDQNGFGFSSVDCRSDGCSPCIIGDIDQIDCTSSDGGGWWFSRCGSVGLNGDWHPSGEHVDWARMIKSA
ncbi:hypothetical protein VZT92_002110 [Zoarces viviparus]|uniref:Fibrinogen C-terminal domain-containing protein n=1 Tax=Zoarces viviparus TaxID=48416 RepID=A0AAW1G1I2_ZOAVI